MRSLNLDPFWRTSVGFDRLFDLVDQSLRLEPEDHYPPCNIVRTGENAYRISLAVAGFRPDQIAVSDGLLQIELERELPEAMKPRRIEIKSGKAGGQDKVRTLEHSQAA